MYFIETLLKHNLLHDYYQLKHFTIFLYIEVCIRTSQMVRVSSVYFAKFNIVIIYYNHFKQDILSECNKV